MITLIVDGFCWPNPGGAMGVSVVCDGKIIASDGYPPAGANTNNRAELLAVIVSLDAAREKVTLYTDSKYAVDGFYSWLAGERHDRPNADLFEKIAALSRGMAIKIQHLPGGNALSDKASRDAALPYLPPRTVAAIREFEEHPAPSTSLYKWLPCHGR